MQNLWSRYFILQLISHIFHILCGIKRAHGNWRTLFMMNQVLLVLFNICEPFHLNLNVMATCMLRLYPEALFEG
jgi:hypothetical protein